MHAKVLFIVDAEETQKIRGNADTMNWFLYKPRRACCMVFGTEPCLRFVFLMLHNSTVASFRACMRFNHSDSYWSYISYHPAGGLCANPFHITKYPTLKIVRHGEVRGHVLGSGLEGRGGGGGGGGEEELNVSMATLQ